MNFLTMTLYGLLAVSVLYLLLFSIAGRLIRRKPGHAGNPAGEYSFAVLIPAYREDSVLAASVQALMEQRYPRHLFQVVVIADSLMPATEEELRTNGVIVLPYAEANRTKAKALNLALRSLDLAGSDVCVILDADNLVEPDFLSRLNIAFHEGIQAAQTYRVAKNVDTTYAYLDALSEGINNHIFRRGHAALGLSAGLIGSGMAFTTDILKTTMQDVDVINGFDKELEFRLFRRGIKIAFLDGIRVYDEKTREANTFRSQRTRWLASQWSHFRKHTRISALVGTTWDFKDKAVQMMILPRVLLGGILTLLFGASALLDFSPGFEAWSMLLFLYGVAMVIAIPHELFNKRLAAALLAVPGAFLQMTFALVTMRRARNKFLHTPHSSNPYPTEG